MRTWVKWTIGIVAAVLVCFAVFAGVGGYYVFRHLKTETAAETDALKEFDGLRARYGSRAPLIEIGDPRTADIRLNRTVDPNGRSVSTIHVLSWKGDEGDRMQMDMPLWLMRFSSVNILSSLGVAPERFRLTVADIQRYGPGIVVDFRQAGKAAVIIWVD